MSKATLPPKRRCRFSNSKTERELQYARREQSRRSSITFSRSASRRMKNSILQNSVESRRKSEKNSIVSGIGCGRTPNHDCAGGNLNLQIPSSTPRDAIVILSEAKDLWHFSQFPINNQR